MNSSNTAVDGSSIDLDRPDQPQRYYRVPLDDSRAMQIATRALNEDPPFQDRRVEKWSEWSGDKFKFMGVKTVDKKGHIKGLEQFEHSKKWHNAGAMTEISEYRRVNGGVRVKGVTRVSPESHNGVSQVEFDGTVSASLSEFKKMLEKGFSDTVKRELKNVKQDAVRDLEDRIHEIQMQCSHPIILEGVVDVCEECGKEFHE